MKISDYKKIITQQLSSVSDSPQLDAELILMHVLNKSRAELLICSNDIVETKFIASCDDLISRRINGEPIAYILGHQPFWTMDLMVTPDTLIPRPETECLIEWVIKKISEKDFRVADLGTGTGAIAIALALENKSWAIDATDLSSQALLVAKKNVEKYAINNIFFYEGDWCNALPHKKYHLIISNPPYIAQNDAHLKKLTFEPKSALISGKKGLDAIEKIVMQSKNFLEPNGYLIIEHGFDQAKMVYDIFEENNFSEIENHCDLADAPRFVTGRKR